MKKGLLFRLIVLVLVCTMLFGLVGFSSLEPKEQTADTQDAETIVTDANEPGTGDEGNPTDPTPTQEPEEKEDGFTVTVKKPAGGTLALKDAAWPENAKETANEVTFVVEEGAELSFVATADDTALKSEFVAATVEYAEADGKTVKDKQAGAAFKVKVDKDITVSAEFFGIQSVTVSKDGEWANAKDGGKTVTVKTFGATDVQLVGGENDGKYIKLESSANGEYVFKITKDIGTEAQKFTVTATKTVAEAATLEATTEVAVNKIDTVAPSIYFEGKVDRRESGDKWSYVTWKITENGSGIKADKNSDISFKRWENVFGNEFLTGADKAQDTWNYDPDTGLLKFKVLAANYNNLVVTLKDNAGNECIVDIKNGQQNVKQPYVEIAGVDKGTYVENGKFYWAGKDAKLLVNANAEPSVTLGEKTFDVTKTETSTGEVGTTQYYVVIEKSGEYMAKNGEDNDSATVKYDPDAPEITSATYHSAPAKENDNWLTRFINNISGGHLFNQKFEIKFATNDGKDDADKKTYASGVDKVEYLLVEGEKDVDINKLSNEGWVAANYDADENNGSAVVPISKDFTGHVVLRVYDKAGNCKCVVVGFTDENGDSTKGELITNEATTNDSERGDNFNPQLTVMAKTDKVDEDGNIIKVDYVASENDKDNWAKKVEFTIYATMPALPTPTDGTTYAYPDDAKPTVTATYGKNKLDVEAEGVENENIYVFTATIGNAGDVSYSGDITFDVSCNAKVTTTTNDTGEPVETDITIHGSSVNVKVNVQNFLNAATVNVDGTPNENGWYNAQDNVLKTAEIVGCAGSTAPYTTNYEIYYQTYQDYASKKPVEGEPVVGTVNNTTKSADITEIIKSVEKPGVHIVKVWSKDAAGNYSYGPGGVEYNKGNPAVYTFMIDIDQPTISALFNGEDSIKYYKDQRVARVTVHDSSFTGNEAEHEKFAADFEWADVKANISKPVEGEWTFDGLNKNWNKEFTFGKSVNDKLGGFDGDDYELTVKAVDNAGNWVSTDVDGNMYYDSNYGDNGKNKAAAEDRYTKVDTKDFRMDQTAPVVTVRFDYNTASHERYFNKGRTATITVVDHNFCFDKGTVKGVEFNVTGKSDNIPLDKGWVSKGNDTYEKKVEFLADNDCTFDIRVEDMAYNVCDYGDVIYDGAAPHDFVIDLTAPELGTTGTQAGPFNENCTPGFSGKDKNISSANGSADYTVRLTRSVREHRNEDVTARFAAGNVTMGSDTISAIYANIPDDAANDGIYTLTVSVTDLAGNSSETSSTFTVNRHGSFYIFNKDLADLVNAKFVQKADGKYSVTEYNASPLVPGSVKIEIYRDNKLIETLKPTIAAGSIGESGLYEYTYDIPAKYFNQDGRYKVWISSEDEATNLSDNTKLEDAAIMFTVDTVAPEIKIIKGLEKARVNAEELEFTANVIDTYGIGSIQIFVDGELVKEYVTQDMYDSLKAKGKDMSIYEVLTENLDFMAAYTLLESTSTQDVEIKVTDMAGNVLTTADEDFDPVYDFHDSVLVSTSFFARYIHNPLALVATGVVIAGAVWFILAKKKKEEKAAA